MKYLQNGAVNIWHKSNGHDTLSPSVFFFNGEESSIPEKLHKNIKVDNGILYSKSDTNICFPEGTFVAYEQIDNRFHTS